eukprot:Tbor_TRINITY_DN7491_c0_g1::TRINITY_DN7491_c0_g1_i1::g.14586::m.14586
MNILLILPILSYLIMVIGVLGATGHTVKGVEEIKDPKTVNKPVYSGPECFPKLNNSNKNHNSFPDGFKALFVIGDFGSSASSIGSSYKYLRDRNVNSENIQILCLRRSTNGSAGSEGLYPISALLMESYYPIGSIKCTPLISFGKKSEKEVLYNFKAYDIIVIPSGYVATVENLRRNRDLQVAIKGFLFPSREDTIHVTRNASLALIGGAGELLIDADLIYNITTRKAGLLNISHNNSFPYMTPSVSAAIYRDCGDLSIHTTASGDIDCGQDNGVMVRGLRTREFAPLKDGTSQYHRALYLATLPRYLGRLLPMYAREELNFMGDVGFNISDIQYFPNCSDLSITSMLPLTTTDLLSQSIFQGVVTLINANLEAWGKLAERYNTTTNATSQLSRVEIDNITEKCKYTEGGHGDFCRGSPVSLIVAHGSDDAEVIAVLQVLRETGMDIRVVCPDAEDEHLYTDGAIYLSPRPSIFPTYKLKCDTYYDTSNLLLSTLVIIVDGPLATHRRLRFDDNLIYVLQRSGRFSLFGSAMALLDRTLIGKKTMRPSTVDSTDVTEVPNCPATDKDMDVLGFINSNPVYGPITLRNAEKQRTKVLGGYPDDGIISINSYKNSVFVGSGRGETDDSTPVQYISKQSNTLRGNFSEFLSHSIVSLVWRSAPSDSIDIAVIVVLGVSIIVLIGVFISRSVVHRCPIKDKKGDNRDLTSQEDAERTSLYTGIQVVENDLYND